MNRRSCFIPIPTPILVSLLVAVIVSFTLAACHRAPATPPSRGAPDPQRVTAAPPADVPASPTEIQFDGHRVTVPAGKPVTIKSTREETDAGKYEKHEGNAAGKGAGLVSAFEKAVVNFNASAPIANLVGLGGASGGTTDIAATFAGKAGTPVLAWIGGLMFVGGVVALCFKRIGDGATLCVGGLVAVGASTLGPAGWLVFILVAAAVGGWLWWKSHKGMRASEALRAVLAGVEDLPETERRLVKSKVKNHADRADTKTIGGFKKADDLPSER